MGSFGDALEILLNESTPAKNEGGWTSARLADELDVTPGAISRWRTGRNLPSRAKMRLLIEHLELNHQAARALFLARASDKKARTTGDWKSLGELGIEDDLRESFKGREGVRRRDLMMGLGAASLDRVLKGAAADALEFTQRVAASAVGQVTLDHLEVAVAEICKSYSYEAPKEVFFAARQYRRQIASLLQGPHTYSEARELYVQAAWLSETLAWLCHDLGDSIAADAYCADSYAHASQAGHQEICAWALDAQASIAHHDQRWDRALRAAEKGIEVVPNGHPLRVRLWAQKARAHAHLGQRELFLDTFARAEHCLCSLPGNPPTRFGKDTTKLAAYAITSYPASSYLVLGDYTQAISFSERAMLEHKSANLRNSSPSRQAIAKLDMATALVGLGDPKSGFTLAQEALMSPRVVGSVMRRAQHLALFASEKCPQFQGLSDFKASATRVQESS